MTFKVCTICHEEKSSSRFEEARKVCVDCRQHAYKKSAYAGPYIARDSASGQFLHMSGAYLTDRAQWAWKGSAVQFENLRCNMPLTLEPAKAYQ